MEQPQWCFDTQPFNASELLLLKGYSLITHCTMGTNCFKSTCFSGCFTTTSITSITLL